LKNVTSFIPFKKERRAIDGFRLFGLGFQKENPESI
jgi:hypothetical protein